MRACEGVCSSGLSELLLQQKRPHHCLQSSTFPDPLGVADLVVVRSGPEGPEHLCLRCGTYISGLVGPRVVLRGWGWI